MELEENIPEYLVTEIDGWREDDESFKNLWNCPDKFISYFFEAWKVHILYVLSNSRYDNNYE